MSGIIWRRRRKLGTRSALNLTKSGASVSTRRGRVTGSSRGRVSFRIGRGISWRIK
jgi:hypothetical protein